VERREWKKQLKPWLMDPGRSRFKTNFFQTFKSKR